jgi:hypothetical protein
VHYETSFTKKKKKKKKKNRAKKLNRKYYSVINPMKLLHSEKLSVNLTQGEINTEDSSVSDEGESSLEKRGISINTDKHCRRYRTAVTVNQAGVPLSMKELVIKACRGSNFSRKTTYTCKKRLHEITIV